MNAGDTVQPKSSAMTTAVHSIPFRSEEASVGGSAVHALLVTSLLLAACLVVLLYAKKQGWLKKWVPTSQPGDKQDAFKVAGALRLSQKTSVYRITDGQHLLVVVESAGTAQIVVLPKGDTNEQM